ncbi:MAG TPA: discoidin domain-containing protein, partial [Cyclobacteriaceae bacterium]|nr:discoidin domain-containing protein [Cyclobacteriaceae bacterium]
GKINLVENYDPNKGGPIVYFYWSNHYLHSSFNNLVISGLCGIRPSEGDTLTINPLIDNSITYFRLDEVLYHGHKVTVIYDKDGSKYNAGKGVTVYVDGVKKSLLQKDGKYQVVVGPPLLRSKSKQPVNYALNIRRKDFPVPSASVNSVPDSLYQALDGRIWYFPEIRNRWATVGSTSKTDWYALDFGQPRDISSLKYYLFTDDKNFGIPDNLTIEYQNEGEWLPVKVDESSSGNPVGNTVNTVAFEKVSASRIRVTFKHETKQLAISEIEYY